MQFYLREFLALAQIFLLRTNKLLISGTECFPQEINLLINLNHVCSSQNGSWFSHLELLTTHITVHNFW